MKLKTILLSTTLSFSAFSIENSKSFNLDLSDLKAHPFEKIEEGLVRSVENNLTIEIEYGSYAVKNHIQELKDELKNLNVKNMKDYEYDYQSNKLIDQIALFEQEMEYLQSNNESINKYGSWSSTNYTCNIPLTQTYTSSPYFWSANLQVQSTFPFPPGPLPPTSHPVEIQAFAIFYPNGNQRADVDTFLGTSNSGGIATAFINSGFTASGAQIPFKAISTIHDRYWLGILGCYTKITVEGFIETSY